jgi:hypothetical protein
MTRAPFLHDWVDDESHLDLLTIMGADDRGVLYSGIIATWSPIPSAQAPINASYLYWTIEGGNIDSQFTRAAGRSHLPCPVWSVELI